MSDQNSDVSLLMPILKQIPLFSALDPNLHAQIIQHIVLMYYPKGYTLFKENDEGDALYIIKQGAVEIYHEPKETGDLPQKVAEINNGGFFGEIALVSETPRNASAKTIIDSQIFILSKQDFKNLLASNTILAEQISATVIARMNENDKIK